MAFFACTKCGFSDPLGFIVDVHETNTGHAVAEYPDAATYLASRSTFTCPRCGRTSHNPNDARVGYCGYCHDWTAPRASAAQAASGLA